jgi:hypothetical protein
LSFPISRPYFLGFSPCSFFLLSLPGPLVSSNDNLTHLIVLYLINHKVEPAIILPRERYYATPYFMESRCIHTLC